MNILVLCTGNSARSILLESLLNKLGAGHIKAFSAGSKPTGKVHPDAVALLDEKGFETGDLRSKSWDEFADKDAPEMDLVITVCANAAGETCPIWPGAPMRAHWGQPDPAAVEDSAARKLAFEEVFGKLREKTVEFMSLNLSEMDKAERADRIALIGAA